MSQFCRDSVGFLLEYNLETAACCARNSAPCPLLVVVVQNCSVLNRMELSRVHVMSAFGNCVSTTCRQHESRHAACAGVRVRPFRPPAAAGVAEQRHRPRRCQRARSDRVCGAGQRLRRGLPGAVQRRCTASDQSSGICSICRTGAGDRGISTCRIGIILPERGVSLCAADVLGRVRSQQQPLHAGVACDPSGDHDCPRRQ